MPTPSNISISGARLWDSLMTMAEIGKTARGGVRRLTLTDLDRQSRDLFARWCEEAGCTMRIDRMGSLFARRPGADDSLPPVMLGSHLDSQPTGGKFDGALGVLAALEVVRTLNDLDIRTRHPIEIVNWTNEEGSRFAPAMTASGVFAGVLTLEQALGLRDADGKVLGAELERIGYAGPDEVGGRPVHAFFELHIEQGPLLEDEGIDIGVVTGANGQKWYDVVLIGVESHAGPTPMRSRRDALVGAARIIEAVNRIGHEHDPAACATVGMLSVQPNSRNVIPGRVDLAVDLRHPDSGRLQSMDEALRKAVAETAAACRLEHEIRLVADFPPVVFDHSCVATIREVARRRGLSTRDITSGAGHDAVYMARVCPAAMIFIPCIGGISHNEAEGIEREWAEAGANVLIEAVLQKAEIVAPAA